MTLPTRSTVHPTLLPKAFRPEDCTPCNNCHSAKPMTLKVQGSLIVCTDCGEVQALWSEIEKGFVLGGTTKSGYTFAESKSPTTAAIATLPPRLFKDFIPQDSVNSVGPEIFRDEIFQQQCRQWGYAIYQIGDRLVRVYCGRPQEAFGNANPPVYDNMPLGQDPRYEMSTQDNLERDRNRTKAVMRLVIAKSKPLDDETQKSVKKIVKRTILTLIEDRR
jgi:hypothetical protein